MIYEIKDLCGEFAENKDSAKSIREDIKAHYFDSIDKIVFNFSGVDSTTQSFIHALISEFFQNHGDKALDVFEYKNCSKSVKSIITTVINYSLE